MKMATKGTRSRGLSSPAVPLTRGGSFSESPSKDNNNNNNNNNNNTNNKGLSLSHSLAQLTNLMSTSFPSRGKRDDKSTPSPEVATLKEEFERKIAAVVFCLEEKAEENIDLSYKFKALQQTSKQRETETSRALEDLQKTLKSKEDELSMLEKKANDDNVLYELNRRIQTLTHCLNDMAEENLKLRTTVNANSAANGKAGNNKNVRVSGSPFSPPPPHTPSSFSADPDPSSSASFLSSLTASSSILSVARSSSSPSPAKSAPSTLSTSSSASSASSLSANNNNNNNKGPIANTASVSTNTSPIPTPITSPNINPIPVPSSLSHNSASLIPHSEAQAMKSEVLGMKSEVLAEELLKDDDWLKRFCDSYLLPPPSSQTLNLLSDIIKQDKVRSEAKAKLSLDDKITELEKQCNDHEDLVTSLKTKLAHETDRTGSLTESVNEYERKLKDLEGRMWDNLNKEAQRRSDAEAKAKRLKKKVDELQFLLDELKDDGSDEDDEEEEEEGEEKKVDDSEQN